MTGHIHAKAMLEYAKDAAKHAEPHKLWECKQGTEPLDRYAVWLPLSCDPTWNKDFLYRRVATAIPWQRIISEGFLLHSLARGYVTANMLGLTRTNLELDQLRIVRERGIRQPYYAGAPKPKEGLVLAKYLGVSYDTSAIDASLVNWDTVQEFIVL